MLQLQLARAAAVAAHGREDAVGLHEVEHVHGRDVPVQAAGSCLLAAAVGAADGEQNWPRQSGHDASDRVE